MSNLLGFALRLGHPILLATTTVLYGGTRWGIYVAGQAGVMVAVRCSALGFDRALLFWLPRRDAERRPSGLLGVVATVVAVASGVSCMGWLLGPLVAETRGLTRAGRPWALMALAIVPHALMDLFVYASVARRRPEFQTIVRELVVPFTFVLLAIGLHPFGATDVGLALAFVGAHALGAVAAIGTYLIWVHPETKRDWSARVPWPFVRYALPLGGAEVLNVVLFRLDALVLAAVADPLTVGVYGVVSQFGNTVRGARASFEPVVHSVAAAMAIDRNAQRCEDGFSYATNLVLATQVPIAVASVLMAPFVLPLFGEGFGRGEVAVAIACVGWCINGVLGLAGGFINGYGGSRATLAISFVTLIGLALALFAWVPRWSIEGAALAVAAAFVLQGLLQCAVMRSLAGTWGLGPTLLPILTRALFGSVAAWAVVRGLESSAPSVLARAFAMLVFLLVFGPAAYRAYRVTAVRPRPPLMEFAE